MGAIAALRSVCSFMLLAMILHPLAADGLVIRMDRSPLRPGDLRYVRVECPSGTSSVKAILGSVNNRRKTLRGFALKEGGGAWGIFLGLPSEARVEPLTLDIQATGKGMADFSVSLELEMAPRAFFSETIPLDSTNTAIRTDTSVEKQKQIVELTSLLTQFDPKQKVFDGLLLRPVDSERVTSQYGDRRVYAYSNGTSATSIHRGIDWGAPKGTPVRAGLSGTVVFAAERISTGNTVVICFAPGLYALYYHMDTIAISTGQIVMPLTIIGSVGSTGLATGPHLHLEIQNQGTDVDPMQFFSRAPIDTGGNTRIELRSAH